MTRSVPGSAWTPAAQTMSDVASRSLVMCSSVVVWFMGSPKDLDETG
jgi:hypothetical protein